MALRRVTRVELPTPGVVTPEALPPVPCGDFVTKTLTLLTKGSGGHLIRVCVAVWLTEAASLLIRALDADRTVPRVAAKGFYFC